MIHKFHDSLKKGQNGEAAFHASWPELERLDGRKHDFICPDGRSLELKTDSYDMQRTENFFIEVWSNWENKKPGGPLQAHNNGTNLWVYFFPTNGTYFVFNTGALVDWLTGPGALYDLVEVKNPRYTTMGIKVPRRCLKHLYTEVTIATANK